MTPEEDQETPTTTPTSAPAPEEAPQAPVQEIAQPAAEPEPSVPETPAEDTQTTASETPTPVPVPGFEPKIIGFLCNWCCYAGADLCGVSRYQYPPNIRNIRVMCSTRIDPYILIQIFKSGADGVFVGGCHIGDCHYISGNFHTKNKIALTQRLLKEAGFDPERLHLEWVSASEGERFSQVITEFTNKIKALGRNPVAGTTPDLKMVKNLDAAESAAVEFRLRALVGKEYKIINEGNVYGNVKTEEEWDEMFDLAIKDEYVRKKILNLTGEQAYSVLDLSKELSEPTDKVLEHIVYLRKNNFVAMDSIDGTTPKYVALQEGGK